MEPVQFHNPPPSAQAPQAQEQGNGLAVAGMVLGIIGLVFCWVPVLGWILALLGLIFGAVGNGKANKIGGKGKGMALAATATPGTRWCSRRRPRRSPRPTWSSLVSRRGRDPHH
jgi:hypothetical protein